MNIAIFSDAYIPIKNGVTTSVVQLKEGLEKWLCSSMTYQRLEFIKEAIGLKALCYKFTMKEVMQDLCEIEISFRVQGENKW